MTLYGPPAILSEERIKLADNPLAWPFLFAHEEDEDLEATFYLGQSWRYELRWWPHGIYDIPGGWGLLAEADFVVTEYPTLTAALAALPVDLTVAPY